MKTLAFFDTKPYDMIWFEKLKKEYDVEFKYYENKLNKDTAILAKGCDGVVAFVNDTIDKDVIDTLWENGITLLAMRCSGYNNIDFKAAYKKIHVVRVPKYSPYAVAEHAMALLLSLNRKIHKAYIRTRDFNFSLNGLCGWDLHGKTMGIIGTGKIGQVLAKISRGFGMDVLGYDLYPSSCEEIQYTELEDLMKRSDVISLHCPLTQDTHYIINESSIANMKDGAVLINTSRGALVDSEALVEALKNEKLGGACLDVYEEESDMFFEDNSSEIIQDDVLARLLSMPNVLITSHQAFLTQEALEKIAIVTLENIRDYFTDGPLKNEICYNCQKGAACEKKEGERCF